jgi:hypothetical protein
MDDFLTSTTAPSNVVTDEYCSLPTSILNTFDTVSFQNTKVIVWMHDVPPRYGKPNDVLLFMAGDEQQQKGECNKSCGTEWKAKALSLK